ncbi:MAG: inositol monophosphatase [Xanthomonadaceae bacterium]|nr:inositol monophosphatase [Xanthomonadaceae bacterium]
MTLPELARARDIVVDIACQELPHRCHITRHHKADGSIVTEADLVVQRRIRAALREEWPEHGFLGEEMDRAEQEQALQNLDQGLWCLDPLDGTNNFASGIPYYAVSLAFLRGDGVQLAIVHDPSREECFTAVRGQGAWLNGQPLQAPHATRRLRETLALVDFKRLPADLVARLAQRPPYASQRSFGAVALDWCWLACGRVQLYLHGGQKLWDYAAGQLILQEAGGRSVGLDGRPVYQAGLQPRSAIAALDAELFEAWREWLGVPPSA